MCRFIAISFRKEGIGVAEALIDALVKSAENDPYLPYPGKSHCHGYGYVAYLRLGSPAIFYERGDMGDCQKNIEALKATATRLKELVRASEGGIVILHARRTGSEPRGSLNAHPFVYVHAGRSVRREFYFAQNGGVDKDSIAFAIGLDPEKYTDSYVALVYMAKDIGYGEDPVSVLERTAKDYTKPGSAFNSALLILEDRGGESSVKLYITVYLGKRARTDDKKKKYYAGYLVKANGLVGYASSTVVYLVRDIEAEEINDKVIEINDRANIIKRVKI